MSVLLTRRRLSTAAALRELEGAGLGGVVFFAGRVRPDRKREGAVLAIEYEAHHEVAKAALERLESRARRSYGAERVVAWHRLGRVPVNDVAVIVGAATGHRAEAFAATRFLIEELKATVPIWKAETRRSARRPRRRPGARAGRSAG